MAITNSCAAGRELPRTRKQPILYTITRTEIGFTDRPRNIQNPSNIILPIWKYCTWDLVLYYSSRILGSKQKCRFELIRYQLEVLSWVINNASSPTMSKEQKQKTSRLAHSTRDQTKQGIRACFFKRKREEVVSAIDLKQGCFGSVYRKERQKEVLILQTMYSKVQ